MSLLVKNIFHYDYFKIIEAVVEDLAQMNEVYNIIVWGHSWEIEAYSLWKKLERLFMICHENTRISIEPYSRLISVDNKQMV